MYAIIGLCIASTKKSNYFMIICSFVYKIYWKKNRSHSYGQIDDQ